MTDKCPYCQSVLTQKRFVKPTVAEVKAYCRERGNNVQASVRTWEKSKKITEASKRLPSSDIDFMGLGKKHNIEARPGESMDQYRLRLTREIARGQ